MHIDDDTRRGAVANAAPIARRGGRIAASARERLLSGTTLYSLVLSSVMLAAPAFVVLGTSPVAEAKTKGKGAATAGAAKDAAKPDPAAAEKALETGIKHYQAGKHEAAIGALNSALQGGGLAAARMARGFYYRGLAYKASGKPAQSISDLTSALWLKGGLDERERADAQEQRIAAYREAGLGEPPAVNLPTRAAKAGDAQPSGSAAAPPPAPKQVADAGTAKAPEGGGVTGSVTSFFGNLFGGGSSAPPEAVGAVRAETATGSVPTPKASEVSSWSSETKASTAGAKVAAVAPAERTAAAPAPVVRAAAHAAPAAPAAPAALSGKYRLQVAAVRTRKEADAIAARLKREFGKKLAAREPVIDEAPVGNMGTFYRVRVGPYADANEPRRLCVSLRASNGFDCLVVTQ